MTHYSAQPLHLPLRPSPRLAALFITVSLAVCGIVLCMPLHNGARLVVCLAVVAATAYAVAHHAWLALPWSCRLLELDTAGKLQLLRRNGTCIEVAVLPDTVANARLTVLNVRAGRRRISLLLTADRVDAEPFRRLRVWLRWGHHDWRRTQAPEEVG
jgi:hypothetical protein